MKIKLPSKENVFRCTLLLILLFFCVTQCLNLLYTHTLAKSIERQQNASRSVYAANAPMIASDALYRLYECGGKIGIYDAKSEVLIDIIDVLVTTLPAADRLALKKGIEIYAFSDLAQIIEDFST